MHTNDIFSGVGAPFMMELGPSILLLMLWMVFWKGLALWHSARHNQPWWFIAILFINILGILEIFYLFVIAKKKFSTLFSK